MTVRRTMLHAADARPGGDEAEGPMTFIRRLRALAETAPPGTLVPVDWIAEALGAGPGPDADPDTVASAGDVAASAPERPFADLTVAEVAAMFRRSPNAVRDWIKQGRLSAYKLNGREYRIPPEAVKAYAQRQRERQSGDAAPENDAGTHRLSGGGDLGAWRRERRAGSAASSPSTRQR